MTHDSPTIITEEEMTIKLADEATKAILGKYKPTKIKVDNRVLANRRDQGLRHIDEHGEAIAIIWSFWEPGDRLRWVQLLIIDGVPYAEPKPIRWPHSALEQTPPEIEE